MKKFKIISVLLLLAASCMAHTPKASTAAERRRALEVINKLEESPMNPALKNDREWVFQFVKSSDVDAMVCSAIIKPLTDQEPSPFRNALMLQNILSSARYSIEHPGSKDRLAMLKASTDCMIRAYLNLVKEDPSRKNPFMESLVEKQRSGELISYVKTNANECSKHPATMLQP